MELSVEEHVRRFLVAHRADQFAFLSALTKVRSENPPGDCAAIREKVRELLERDDLTLEVHDLPDELTAAAGCGEMANLVVRREFGEGPTIALSAHLDTAPAGARWTRDPFDASIEGGRMYGRGVSDGKGDLAAYFFALLALMEIEERITGTIELHITFDGLSGGELGVKCLLDGPVSPPDWAIVPGNAHAVGTSSTGVLNLQVEITGQAAPAGQPQSGADALEGAAHVLHDLYGLRDALRERTSEVPGIGSPTMVVTEIAGGTNPLSVPESVSLLIDRRVLPEEDPDAAEAEITNTVGRAVVRVPGVVCKVRRRRLLPAATLADGAGGFVEVLKRHAENILGEDVPEYGVSYETAARHYAAAGVPMVLYGAGPSLADSPNTAGPDEYLVLDDLRVCTEVITLALADWLQAPEIQEPEEPDAQQPERPEAQQPEETEPQEPEEVSSP